METAKDQELPIHLLGFYIDEVTSDVVESEEILRDAEQRRMMGKVLYLSSVAFTSVICGMIPHLNDRKTAFAYIFATAPFMMGAAIASDRADRLLETAHANHVQNVRVT